MEGEAEESRLAATQFEAAREWYHLPRGSIPSFSGQASLSSLGLYSFSSVSLCSVRHRFQSSNSPVHLTTLNFQFPQDLANVNLGHDASPCLPSGEDHDGHGLRLVNCNARCRCHKWLVGATRVAISCRVTHVIEASE